jgi:pre-rRNA-processing protein TSR1
MSFNTFRRPSPTLQHLSTTQSQAHKAGRTAGKSAREKHRVKKEGGGGAHRRPIKSSSASTKAERAQCSKQARDAKRQQVLERRRKEGAPLVVAILPLSAAADCGALWRRLTAAMGGSTDAQHAGGGGGGMEIEAASSEQLAAALGVRPHTACVQGRARLRLTLLPPPRERADPLAYVELGRAADVLLLALPGGERAAAVDAEGALALRVLRAMGLPACVGVVLGGEGGGGDGSAAGDAAPNMKERSAAKRRAEKALGAHLAGETRLLHCDGAADAAQLLRHLADAAPQPPLWRRARPAILVQEASFQLDAADTNAAAAAAAAEDAAPAVPAAGVLRLTGYVRGAGLSANQLVTVPGAGDYKLVAIEGPADPALQPARAAPKARAGGGGGGGGDLEMEEGGAALPAAAGAGGVPVLAVPDPEQQDDLVRENVLDPMLGEQTWPTDEELRDAELAAAAAARQKKRRKLPPGTSDYQAAWIMDDMSGGESDYESEDAEDEGAGGGEMEADGGERSAAAAALGGGGAAAGGSGAGAGGGGFRFDEEGGDEDLDHLAADDPGTDGMLLLDEEDEEEERRARGHVRAMREEMRRQRLVGCARLVGWLVGVVWTFDFLLLHPQLQQCTLLIQPTTLPTNPTNHPSKNRLRPRSSTSPTRSRSPMTRRRATGSSGTGGSSHCAPAPGTRGRGRRRTTKRCLRLRTSRGRTSARGRRR